MTDLLNASNLRQFKDALYTSIYDTSCSDRCSNLVDSWPMDVQNGNEYLTKYGWKILVRLAREYVDNAKCNTCLFAPSARDIDTVTPVQFQWVKSVSACTSKDEVCMLLRLPVAADACGRVTRLIALGAIPGELPPDADEEMPDVVVPEKSRKRLRNKQ